MAPKFGTSGLRGLVTELDERCVGDHVGAFIAACQTGTGLFVGHDLRDSSPDIARMVMNAARACGLQVTDCGAVPTPALALASTSTDAAAVMITGSHIPADRNGLKFYTPNGEITKADEAAIVATLGAARDRVTPGDLTSADDVGQAYLARYTTAFGADALAGMRIGIYAHSAVGRGLMADLLRALGAEPVMLGASDSFIPVDTEAVAPEIRQHLRDWAAAERVDAIVSTDADGDRPLVTNELGEVVPGDILGQIAATMLGADKVVTPISSNTGVSAKGVFDDVVLTRIGSPYVIAAMEDIGGQVVGYEANGGFLLGFSADGPAGILAPLMTRDALLPMLCVLTAARSSSLSALVAAEPPRFTAADRLQEVPTARSTAYVAKLTENAADRAGFLAHFDGAEAEVNTTDGLRMTLTDGRVLHLRPSGNAPELRLYVEATDRQVAQATLDQGLAVLRTIFTG
ncbi:phosphomannomutase [Yoonia sp. SS1-5]|uniref:Phosphomannomutase n=1 Tax=Yoonia rhodophyticola TaxID=3137370 RepID=A0AAN0MA53_9RHOB